MNELKILKVAIFENDYIVEIQRPDGSKLHVMIPVENRGTHENKCIVAANNLVVFGLNLVTDGHYQ